jgi:hypothetical protein
MGSFYRKQEEMRLDLPGGDWLLVRKHLTAGEVRGAQIKTIKNQSGDRPVLDFEQVGIAQAVIYLLDWSITDVNDQPIRIRDAAYDFVAAALRNMTPDGLQTILEAIQAHDAAMTAEREHEKKVRAGTIAPVPISTSVG